MPELADRSGRACALGRPINTWHRSGGCCSTIRLPPRRLGFRAQLPNSQSTANKPLTSRGEIFEARCASVCCAHAGSIS